MTARLGETVDDGVHVDAQHRPSAFGAARDDGSADVAFAGVADAERAGEQTAEVAIATRADGRVRLVLP